MFATSESVFAPDDRVGKLTNTPHCDYLIDGMKGRATYDGQFLVYWGCDEEEIELTLPQMLPFTELGNAGEVARRA